MSRPEPSLVALFGVDPYRIDAHDILFIRYTCRLDMRREYHWARQARVAELVDALDLGSSGATRESSSLSFRTSIFDSSNSLKKE